MIYSTGNEIVDRLGEVNISGNIIPHTWYSRILRDNGKPYLNAIIILSDIVYWYRPTELRDECTGGITGMRKRFKGKYLQRSYQQIADQFGIGKKEAKTALQKLEALGIIRRKLDTVVNNGFVVSNVMYLILNPGKLKEISFPHIAEQADGSDEAKQNAAGETQQDASHETQQDAFGETDRDASGETQQHTSNEAKQDASGETQQDASNETQQDAYNEAEQNISKEKEQLRPAAEYSRGEERTKGVSLPEKQKITVSDCGTMQHTRSIKFTPIPKSTGVNFFYPHPQKDTGVSPRGHTYTENTTENTNAVGVCKNIIYKGIMTHTQFDALTALYGRELVAAKIERAKSYRGCDNYDTVAKWCSEDNGRIRAKPPGHSEARKGGFHDFHQREYDFDALEAKLLKQ